jgi:YgiT-type zinc finger domain-containing protein
MDENKECPLCGGTMTLTTHETIERKPSGQTATRVVREWVCPECDNWEEIEDER